jgi:hypothetical protein
MINKKRKPDTEIKGKAKEKTKSETTKPEPVQEEHVPEEKVTQPVLEVTPTPTPTPTPETKVEPPAATPPSKPKPLTLVSLKTDVDALNKCLQLMDLKLEGFEALVAMKRRPPANSNKVQIRDKQTNKLYPSKNSVYQNLLKAGETNHSRTLSEFMLYSAPILTDSRKSASRKKPNDGLPLRLDDARNASRYGDVRPWHGYLYRRVD